MALIFDGGREEGREGLMGVVWSVCVGGGGVGGVEMVQLGQTEGPIKHSTARSQTQG